VLRSLISLEDDERPDERSDSQRGGGRRIIGLLGCRGGQGKGRVWNLELHVERNRELLI